MNIGCSLILNRLRVLQQGNVAYDEVFHAGINIIRGQNGSGKTTIADFIFFILGGEFDDWKVAATYCDEVQAEIMTTNGTLTLCRKIESKVSPVSVYFGNFEDASVHALEGWESYPIRRQGSRESFSQIMFRSLGIPEAQSDGAANITMHQLLRLCYSDQRTPASRLFRFESFDTQAIREAVGDLLFGISGYEKYEIGLRLRELKSQIEDIKNEITSKLRSLTVDQSLNTPALITDELSKLEREKNSLFSEIIDVDKNIETHLVKGFLNNRKKSQSKISKERRKIEAMETSLDNLSLEMDEITSFNKYLLELSDKLKNTETTFDHIGAIEFIHCPACGSTLDDSVPDDHCIVCQEEIDSDREKDRYNQIRMDLNIQLRETKHLLEQKESKTNSLKRDLRTNQSEHESSVTEHELKFAGANGPRDSYLAERSSRIGHIDAEITALSNSLNIAEELQSLEKQKISLDSEFDKLEKRKAVLSSSAEKRRRKVLSLVAKTGASILRSDFPRQEEFQSAKTMQISFWDDSASVDGKINFAESSNVFLKNTAVVSILLEACKDSSFNHPRLLLLDNIEDKGMEEARSHLFQKIVVETATQSKVPFQIIMTTSMMNPELELDDYVIGPHYTNEKRSLSLVGDTK